MLHLYNILDIIVLNIPFYTLTQKVAKEAATKIIEQKHESNYNHLHFLIYLLHILGSISTDFSLLQE